MNTRFQKRCRLVALVCCAGMCSTSYGQTRINRGSTSTPNQNIRVGASSKGSASAFGGGAANGSGRGSGRGAGSRAFGGGVARTESSADISVYVGPQRQGYRTDTPTNSGVGTNGSTQTPNMFWPGNLPIQNPLQNMLPELNGLNFQTPGAGNGTGQAMGANTSTGRSASFMENGKRVSIRENDSGITITRDGTTITAVNANELKERYPEEYKLYQSRTRSVSARGMAGGSSTTQEGAQPDRKVSVSDNGRKVNITQDESGITVTIDGRTVHVATVDELKNHPEVLELYSKYVGRSPANSPTGARQVDAKQLLREELKKFRSENAGNPQVQGLIDKMMQEIPQ